MKIIKRDTLGRRKDEIIAQDLEPSEASLVVAHLNSNSSLFDYSYYFSVHEEYIVIDAIQYRTK
jgi:hypothetical protein